MTAAVTGFRIPAKSLRQHTLLQVMMTASGTFYQVCERAGIDIEASTSECAIRSLFESLIQSGAAKLDGIVYSVTARARLAMSPKAAAPDGPVATPHYRGPNMIMPVTVARRANSAMQSVARK